MTIYNNTNSGSIISDWLATQEDQLSLQQYNIFGGERPQIEEVIWQQYLSNVAALLEHEQTQFLQDAEGVLLGRVSPLGNIAVAQTVESPHAAVDDESSVTHEQPPSPPRDTKACNVCLKEKTSKTWHDDPDGTTRCQACFDKARRIKDTCPACLKEKTTRWDKNPNDPTTLCCHACYTRVRRLKKGEATSEEVGESSHAAVDEKSSITDELEKNPYAKVFGQKRRLVPEATVSGADKKSRPSELIPPHNHSSQDDELRSLGANSLPKHKPQNSLPILQDPDDPSRSLLLEQEGPIEKIKGVSWDPLSPSLNRLPLQERALVKEKIRKEMREWLTLNEFHREEYAKKLDNLGTVIIPEDGPPRGRSLFAKRKIKQFKVIGPYSGALHTTEESLTKSIDSHGSSNIYTYLFETRSSSRNVDAFGKGNILSLINTGELPNQPAWKENNLAALLFGKNLRFYVAMRVIEKGEELLVDYGPDYDPT